MVEVAVDKAPGSQNMYTRVMETAEQKEDHQMMARFCGVANGDLVAVEARYHRKKGCFSHYIKDKHVAAQQKEIDRTNANKKAIFELIEEYRPPIVQEKQVFPLTTLKTQFQEIAATAEIENSEVYSSHRIKKQLMEECPDIAFISQPGMSDLIFSSEISVGDVLKKINTLMKVVKEMSDKPLESETPDRAKDSYSNEEVLVHRAIGILRRRMMKPKGQMENCYSSEACFSAEEEIKLTWQDATLIT